MVIEGIGFDKLVKKFEEIADDTDDIREVVKAGTENVLVTARALCPVDTGFLRYSIKADLIDTANTITGKIYTTVSYGLYQEFGTWKMRPQPFLRPALDRHKAGIRASLNKVIKQKLK